MKGFIYYLLISETDKTGIRSQHSQKTQNAKEQITHVNALLADSLKVSELRTRLAGRTTVLVG